ncbi:hypothetical protein IIA79_00720 [bacterium]|nr:hypothetical protein [bacterium]
MGRVLLAAGAAIVLAAQYAWAGEDDYISGSEEAFEQLRRGHNPGYSGQTVEEAIAQFFPKSEVDLGTYPPSDIWKRGFDLRRTKPDRLRYSGRTFFKFSDDDISGVEKWEKELELNLRYGDYSGYFRFSDVNPFARSDDPFKWEKGRVRYRHKDLKVTGGTFGAVFGRGLALNMFEERTLDFDNEVEGVKVEQDVGDTDLSVIWGTKHESELSAARAEIPLNDDVELGLSAVMIRFPGQGFNPETSRLLEYDIYGADLNVRLGDFRFFGEAVALKREPNDTAQLPWNQQGEDGRGYYVNVGYNGDGYALVAEYKDYDKIDNPFAIVPPVRRWYEQATASADDEKGYGVNLNWNPFGDGSYFTFGYEQDNIHDGNLGYTEASATYNSPVTGDTSWIGEYWYVNFHGEKHDIKRLTLSHQVDGHWTAGTFLEKEDLAFEFADGFTDYIVETELSYKSKYNVVFSWETSGVQGVDETEWGIWEFKFQPDSSQEINISAGSRRERYVCSGGVCRLEPAFDGVRVDYLKRF